MSNILSYTKMLAGIPKIYLENEFPVVLEVKNDGWNTPVEYRMSDRRLFTQFCFGGLTHKESTVVKIIKLSLKCRWQNPTEQLDALSDRFVLFEGLLWESAGEPVYCVHPRRLQIADSTHIGRIERPAAFIAASKRDLAFHLAFPKGTPDGATFPMIEVLDEEAVHFASCLQDSKNETVLLNA